MEIFYWCRLELDGIEHLKCDYLMPLRFKGLTKGQRLSVVMQCYNAVLFHLCFDDLDVAIFGCSAFYTLRQDNAFHIIIIIIFIYCAD